MTIVYDPKTGEVAKQLPLFDYATLDTETRVVVQQRTSEIKALVRKTAQDIIDIGTKLIDVKTRLQHGQFGAWLEAEFAWSEPTAQRFMRVSERFKTVNLTDLQFGTSALYLLAAPSTSDEARAEALERAQAGEPITHKTAKEIVAGEKDDTEELAQRLINETAPKGNITPAHIQSVVTVLKEMKETGAIDPGTGEMLPLSSAMKAAVTEETYERMKRQETYIADKMAKKDAEKANPETGSFYDAGHYDYDAPPKKLAAHQLISQSKSNEWYTPAPYVEAARWVMGHIDVDPASCEYANQTVQAKQIYTIDTDGLAQDWIGNVWLNPPYGRDDDNTPNQQKWSDYLITQYKAGNVKQAVLLVNAVTDRSWFQPLWDYPICFVEKRIKFYSQDTDAGQPTHGNVLVYFGDHVTKFYQRFQEFGRIVIPARLYEGAELCKTASIAA